MNYTVTPVLNASVVVNPSKKSFAASQYDANAAKIESIANALYVNPKMSHNLRKQLEGELTTLLLKAKNLTAFIPGQSDSAELLVNQYKADKYSGLVFTKCYQYAWKQYGTLDKDTGEVVPFLKWFNYLYKLNKGSIIAEAKLNANVGETKYKEAKLKDLLSDALEETGFQGTLPRINVLNKRALSDQLILMGAPRSYLDEVDMIFDNNDHVEGIEVHDADGSEMDRSSADRVYLDDYAYANLIVETIVTTIEHLTELSRCWKDTAVSNNLTYYITLKVREYFRVGDERLVLLLKEFVDEDLLEFAYEHDDNNDDNDVQILTEYTGQKYNTVRKKLKKVEHAFGDMSCNFTIAA